MKSPVPFLGLLLATLAGPVLAEEVPPAPPPAEPAKEQPPAAPPALSPSNGTATPAAAPAPFTPLVNPEPEEKPADPNVLQLPKMVVKQKPRPRLTPEIMVTKKAFGEQLARQKSTELELVLNKFTLPLFGTSAAERALDEHERAKRAELNQDVSNLAKALETTDPNEAKSLKEAARP